MKSSIVAAIVALAALAAPAAAAPSDGTASRRVTVEDGSFEVAGACGWYAIYSCSRSPNVGGPGYTVSTNGYPNFRKGWFCNLGGPFASRADALRAARKFGGYAKQAC